MLVEMNRVRMVCYSLASSVLWMCSSLLSLDVSVESCVCVGYVFKCIHVLRLIYSCLKTDRKVYSH